MVNTKFLKDLMKALYGLFLLLVFSYFMQQALGMEEKIVVFEGTHLRYAFDDDETRSHSGIVEHELSRLNKLEAMAKRAYDDLVQNGMSGLIQAEALEALELAKKRKGQFKVIPWQISKEEMKSIREKSNKKSLLPKKEALVRLVQIVQLNGGYIKFCPLLPERSEVPLGHVKLFEKNGDSIDIDGSICQAAYAAGLPPFNQ